jgi:hypothetical protein
MMKFSQREEDSEHRRYAPKWMREQSVAADEPRPYVDSASVSPTSNRAHRNWPPISDFNQRVRSRLPLKRDPVG